MSKTAKTKKYDYKVDGITINKALIEKILEQEKTKKISLIEDLSELNTKSESELYDVIRKMMQNKTFFKYCYSLLININPGPEYVYDYLNLKDWVISEENNKNNRISSNIPKNEIKPHLYSFMQYVYETMKIENKDQVVSILGPLGSGKTFNLVHIMEYFATLYSFPNHNTDNFELIHKSVQFIHILGSIFRENNLESSSCGILLSLGFDSNHLINSFDIQAQILDFTLPLNEKGRTFSIFHALLEGANDELKRKSRISMSDDNLFNLKKSKKINFYRNEKEKEKFKLNDLEIWNRFYSLLKYFKFSKNEMLDIINSLSFILNVDELVIIKYKGGKLKNIDIYQIQIGITTKKLCKNLGIKTDDKIEEFENKLKEYKFKTLQEAELFIQGLMKQTYYMIFEYVLQRIRTYINEYFTKINQLYDSNNSSKKNKTFNSNKSNNYIYFIDFPGQVEERGLGGFATNIANECLNMYSASTYYEIVEKILTENVLLKKFKPMKSYFLLSNCFNTGGILDYFTKPFSYNNFIEMKQSVLNNLNAYSCIKFPESKKNVENDYNFYCSFSEKNTIYNFEYLYYESKTILFNPKINVILSYAKNIIINTISKSIKEKLQSNFYDYFISCLHKFFTPIKNYKPFVVYCLHSYDSYKYFFSKKDQKFKNNNLDISLNIIKHSMIPAILNWNWHGFKEWIKIDDFLKEFGNDFEKVKNRIILINNNDPNNNKLDDNNIDFSALSKKEKVQCMLNILARDFDYLLGNEYIIMKRGTLKRIVIYFNSMIDTADTISKNFIKNKKSSNITTAATKNNLKKGNLYNTTDKNKSRGKDENNSSGSISKKNTINLEKSIEKQPLPHKKNIKFLEDSIYSEKADDRRKFIKDQCSLEIITQENNALKPLIGDNKNIALKSKYLNINYILDKNKNKKKNNNPEELGKFEDLINFKDEKTMKNIPSKSNTVISDPVIFNKIKNIFDPTKSKNIKLFDYSDYVDLIIKIQTIIRSLKAQKKYKILKYLSKPVVLVQKFVRGLLTRKKVKFFLKCSKCVAVIQKLYKKRYKKLNESAKKIQDYFRFKKKQRKERDTIILKRKLEIEKEKNSYIDVDKIMKNALSKKDKDLHQLVLNIGKENDKDIISNKNRNISIDDKAKKKDATNELKNEKNKGKMIELLLYSHMPGDTKVYRKKIKRSNSDFYKIEDRLILCGEQTKKKLEKKKTESMEKEEADTDLYFNPKISKKNMELTQKFPNDFLKRLEYYKLFKNRNLENLRNKYLMNNYSKLNDMRFEPKLNNYPYNNIGSKLFNFMDNNTKMNKDKNDLEKNNIEGIKEDEMEYPEKSTGNKNGINKEKDIIINEENDNNILLADYQTEDLWPKEMQHKFLESKNIEKIKDE